MERNIDLNRFPNGNFPNGANNEDDNNFFQSPIFNQRKMNDAFRSVNIISIILALVGSIVSLLAGLTIKEIKEKKEVKKMKKQIMGDFLLPDEKKIIEYLSNNDEESTQSKIVKETGMSKIQVHRTLLRLEEKRLIKKQKYGLTNKIILEREKI